MAHRNRKQHSKKLHKCDKQKLARRHTIFSIAAILVCGAVAWNSTDAHITTFSGKLAEITGAAVWYWWVFGSLEI